MVKRRHRKKDAYRDESLVPIDCELLQALMDEQGLTVAEMARRTGDREQTVAHHYKGQGTHRCRRPFLGRMAKALGAADELLVGGQVVIPHLPAMPRGYEFLYSRRTELAASRLLTKAASACDRDLDDPTLSPPDLERLAPRQIIVGYVIQYLSELLQIGEWRNRLIEWDPAARERRGYSEPATENPWTPKQRVAEDADHERAVLGLAHALEHTLAPWFGSSAGFNYRALRDLTHLPAHPFAAGGENIPSTSPYAVLLPSTVANAQAKPPPPTTRSKRTRSSSKSRRRKGKR